MLHRSLSFSVFGFSYLLGFLYFFIRICCLHFQRSLRFFVLDLCSTWFGTATRFFTRLNFFSCVLVWLLDGVFFLRLSRLALVYFLIALLWSLHLFIRFYLGLHFFLGAQFTSRFANPFFNGIGLRFFPYFLLTWRFVGFLTWFSFLCGLFLSFHLLDCIWLDSCFGWKHFHCYLLTLCLHSSHLSLQAFVNHKSLFVGVVNLYLGKRILIKFLESDQKLFVMSTWVHFGLLGLDAGPDWLPCWSFAAIV